MLVSLGFPAALGLGRTRTLSTCSTTSGRQMLAQHSHPPAHLPTGVEIQQACPCQGGTSSLCREGATKAARTARGFAAKVPCHCLAYLAEQCSLYRV